MLRFLKIPESADLKQYSFSSDMYSIGRVMMDYAEGMSMMLCFYSESGAHSLFYQVEKIVHNMICKKPENRIAIVKALDILGGYYQRICALPNE